MTKQHNIGGMYDAMDFPPYVFREYPKRLYKGPGDKQGIVVQNLKEELSYMADVEPDAVLEPLAKERDSLAAKLENALAKNASNEAAIAALMAEVQAMKNQLKVDAMPKTKTEPEVKIAEKK